MNDIQQIIQEFNNLINARKVKSINIAAAAMDIAPARLSTFLKGTYKGNIPETAQIVKNYIELIRERELTVSDETEFIRIKNAEQVLNICRLVHVQKTFGIITSRAGFGKTIPLQKYAETYKDVLYIEVDRAYNARELMNELHDMCGYSKRGSINQQKKEIINKLKNSGRMIIVDQCEALGDKSIDLLKTIHDKANIGILLAGMPRLMELIKGIGGIHEQLYTRVGAALELKPLGDEDIEKLTQSFLPGSNGLYKDFIKPCNRNARVLRILCREAKRIAQNKKMNITPEIIAMAKRQLIHEQE